MGNHFFLFPFIAALTKGAKEHLLLTYHHMFEYLSVGEVGTAVLAVNFDFFLYSLREYIFTKPKHLEVAERTSLVDCVTNTFRTVKSTTAFAFVDVFNELFAVTAFEVLFHLIFILYI